MFHEVYLPSFSSSHKNRGNWGELTFAEALGIVTRDTPVSLLLIGRLSNNDGDVDGYELRCLKLYRDYSISFNSSNVGNFFLELNYKGFISKFRKRKGQLLSCVPVLDKS